MRLRTRVSPMPSMAADRSIRVLPGVHGGQRWQGCRCGGGRRPQRLAPACGRHAPTWMRPGPPTARLVARRLRSHSNGAGRVSSKSLTSNTGRPSGEAKAPKLARWQSPQDCTRQATGGRGGKVRRHDGRGAPQKRERVGAHPGVAHGQQRLDAAGALIDQNLHRVGAARRRRPFGVAAARQGLAPLQTRLERAGQRAIGTDRQRSAPAISSRACPSGSWVSNARLPSASATASPGRPSTSSTSRVAAMSQGRSCGAGRTGGDW